VSGYKSACTYCGRPADTVDHVPPKLLLRRPYPPNLRTVPACQNCNRGFQKDDEYVRTVLSLDTKASDNSVAKANLPAVLRALKRPESVGFRQHIAKRATPTRIVAWDGKPFAMQIDIERDRLNAVGRRLVRGLHFAETGAILPAKATLNVGFTMQMESTKEAAQHFVRVLRHCHSETHGEVGEGFSYAAGFLEGQAIWFFLLFELYTWMATVDERAPLAADGDGSEQSPPTN
jgi:hypothetical protein